MQRVTRLFILLTMLALVFGTHTPHPVQAAGTWETVGITDFPISVQAKMSFSMDNGVPYVAYIDGINVNKIIVIKFNGTEWETVGSEVFSAVYINSVSLDVANHIPFVAYRDPENSNKAAVKKFNGTSWEFVGPAAFSDGGVEYLSVVIDHGTPYVAYMDFAHNSAITVKKFDGTNWTNVGTPGFSSGGQYASFAVENGVPYVAFLNPSQRVTVMKFNGTTWETIGSAGFSAGYASYISIAIENGIPFVAYKDFGNDGKVMVMKFNGTNWAALGATGIPVESLTVTSMEVQNGMPYVAFSDPGHSSKATVMKFNGTNWVTVGSAGFSAHAVYTAFLEMDNGVPYVAFQDVVTDQVSVMKFNSSTNSPPTDITLSNDHVPQNLPVGSTIGKLTAIDADPGDLHAYSLTCAAPGPDDASFKVGGGENDQLQTNAIFDYNIKNAYNICVRTDDGSEGIFDKNFTVHVTTVVPTKVSFRSIGVNDGWILESVGSTNRGGFVNNLDTVLRLGDTELDQEYRSILSFNTINLPDTAIITKVTLKIKKQLIIGTDPFTNMGKLFVDIRAPHFGASAALAKPDFQAPADVRNIGDIPKTPISDWYRKIWSSDTFFTFINLTGRTQFRLHFAKGDNDNSKTDYLAIYSGDYATVTDRPMLIIEYYVP